ncbi:MAG: hypothetical protein LIO86_03975 [Lachnospiraceae bacterium]|nr:hypothetical protein [Lachnospiraceae bacterium]MCD8363230.1 hypothetical protein [Lachnospiraceae bacterium]
MGKNKREFALICKDGEELKVNLYEVPADMRDTEVKDTLFQAARDFLSTRAEQRGVGFEYDVFCWENLSTVPESCFEKYGIRVIQNHLSSVQVDAKASLLD